MSVVPGGRGSQDSRGLGGRDLVGAGTKLASKAAKPLADYFLADKPSFDRGSTEGAYQEQRAGERASFAPDVSGAQKPMLSPGAFGPSFASDVLGGSTGYTPNVSPAEFSGAMKPGLGSGFAEPAGASYAQSSGAGVSPGASTTGGFNAGGLGAGLAGAGIGALYGMAPGLIAKGLGVDPKTGAVINAAAGLAAPAATAATTGALGMGAGAAAGGGMAGAGAGLAAAGPALIAAAPLAALKIGTDLYSMFEAMKTAAQLKSRFGGLASSIPGHIAAFQQKVPPLLQQLQGVKDPTEAARIYGELEKIQSDFQNTGMEDFLKRGMTEVQGGEGLEGSMSAQFPQGPKIMEALKPYGQMMDVGRIRATDIAANAGQPIPGARGIADYGLTMGTPEANDATRPGAGIQSGQLAEFLGMSGTGGFNPLAGSREGMTALGAAGRDLGEAADPALLKYAGLPEGHTATVGDIFNYMEAGGAGKGRADQFGQTDFGYTHMPSFQEMSQIQPGNYEKGLADFFGSRGGMQAGLDQYGFGTGSLPDAGGVGGVPQGGAGKRQTPFLTPELDNRAEAAAGKLGGGRQETGDPGTPFGMSGKRGGGMGVGGAPQRQGGRPGGNAPFGGMARQTMMPQQGGGVQARRPGQQGVV